jgi:transposase
LIKLNGRYYPRRVLFEDAFYFQSLPHRKSSEQLIRDIKRNTRSKYSSEEKIRIVIEGMRGETSIADLCRREGINQNQYYRWSKDFMESGKKRLDGDTRREANTSEVQSLRKENTELKEVVAELLLKNRVLKKSMNGEDSSE